MPRIARFLAVFVPLVISSFLCACETAADTRRHDEPSLQLTTGARGLTLRTDLDAAIASSALGRLEKLEALLDERFPWLGGQVVTVSHMQGSYSPGRPALVIFDDARFRQVAKSHGIMDPNATAFACPAGEVVFHWRAEEWGQGPTESWVQAPRGAAVAETVFRRRLEQWAGPSLERTALEDGCARYFSELAARELGEPREAARRGRDDLLAAFLPLFLSNERVLVKTASARGHDAAQRGPRRGKTRSGPSFGYAVARYLLEAEGGKRVGALKAALAAAAGKPGAEEEWAKEREELVSQEDAFDRWLRGKTTDALLDALTDEPVAEARWEPRQALRLIAALDVEEERAKTPEAKAALAGRARALVAKATTVRFLDELSGQIAHLRDARRPGELEAFVKEAKALLEERAHGYGHPALEDGRAHLPQTIQERLRSS